MLESVAEDEVAEVSAALGVQPVLQLLPALTSQASLHLHLLIFLQLFPDRGLSRFVCAVSCSHKGLSRGPPADGIPRCGGLWRARSENHQERGNRAPNLAGCACYHAQGQRATAGGAYPRRHHAEEEKEPA